MKFAIVFVLLLSVLEISQAGVVTTTLQLDLRFDSESSDTLFLNVFFSHDKNEFQFSAKNGFGCEGAAIPWNIFKDRIEATVRGIGRKISVLDGSEFRVIHVEIFEKEYLVEDKKMKTVTAKLATCHYNPKTFRVESRDKVDESNVKFPYPEKVISNGDHPGFTLIKFMNSDECGTTGLPVYAHVTYYVKEAVTSFG